MMRLPDPSSTEEERAFLQTRVALFWKVIFLIALLPDTVQVIVDPVGGLLRTGAILDRFSTLLFGALWLVCRSGRRSAPMLLAVEWVGLAIVSVVIGVTGRYLATEVVAQFVVLVPGADPESLALARAADAFTMINCVLGGSLLFTVRAALIPSPPWRTLVLTGLLGLPYVLIPFYFAPASTGLPALRTAEFPIVGSFAAAIWWAIISLGATVVSHIVFGLRAEIREARRLGQYTLEQKLGEGGMGVVYRATHAMLRRPTAVKLLRAEQTGEQSLLRFEREVRLTAELSHPNTVAIYDFGRTPDGLFYYAMEYLDGVDLQRLIDEDGPQPPERTAHVLRQVLGALAEAHEIGLIHRDIKPGNIVLCARGGVLDVAKVVDFGLVKQLDADDGGLSRAGALIGTPLYMAPEAIRSGVADPRSDLYALGAVGYFLLTGSHVFSGQTAMEICGHHLHTQPVPPSKRLGLELPEPLEGWVMRCLEKDPAARFASAREAARQLDDEGLTWPPERARDWWDHHRDLYERERRESSAASHEGTGTMPIDPLSR